MTGKSLYRMAEGWNGARIAWLALAMCAWGMTGCASARYVERQADSGVVAIPENSNHWPTYYRQAALDLIEKHVGPHYEILEEREVVVGQQTSNNQQIGPDFLAGLSTTRELTEWRIAYRRAAVPSVGGAYGSQPARTVPVGGPAGSGNTRAASQGNGIGGVQPAGGLSGNMSGGSQGVIPSVAPPPPSTARPNGALR